MSPAHGLLSETPPSTRFLERIRSTLAHDLRSPLGAIVNFAAVLDETPGSSTDEVRAISRRIRDNAHRIARMLQFLARASELASAPTKVVETDLLVLARTELVATGGRGVVRAAQGTGPLVVEVDPDPLAFAFGAYFEVLRQAEQPLVEVEVARIDDGDGLRLELRSANPTNDPALDETWSPSPEEGPAGLSAFLRRSHGSQQSSGDLALSLACDLWDCLGGSLEAWGEAHSRSGLLLRLPPRP